MYCGVQAASEARVLQARSEVDRLVALNGAVTQELVSELERMRVKVRGVGVMVMSVCP